MLADRHVRPGRKAAGRHVLGHTQKRHTRQRLVTWNDDVTIELPDRLANAEFKLILFDEGVVARFTAMRSCAPQVHSGVGAHRVRKGI